MEFTISNEQITAVISSQAAEVISLKDNETEKEYVWCRDPKFWYNCNPILFPFHGPLPDNKYTYEGKEYMLTQHGFLRRAQFNFEYVKKDSCCLSFEADESSLAVYPFNFKITVTYTLQDRKINLAYKIENRDNKMLPFMIGFHPAFNCPDYYDPEYQNYYIQFENEENVNGIITDKMYLKDVINEEQPQIFFYNHQLKSNYVTLTNGTGGLRVQTGGYAICGYWSKCPEAPFVCIEPWDPDNDLPKEKTFKDEYNNLLAPEKSYECSYYWEIL